MEYLDEVTVAPITTTIRDIPREILLNKREGVPADCAINFDHMQTVSKGKLCAVITTLSEEKLRGARKAVMFALDL